MAPPRDDSPATAIDADAPGVGPYHLVSVLGEGGFGVVYLAERRAPFVQAVALKVLKAGMDSPSLVARFELERQALALMDHPNVARVLDGGVTERGSRLGSNRPYFAMELVVGKPITEFCRENALGVRERLELFVPVCEAVQYAHTKGVVHRDLKPSNILVGRGAADGQAHGEPIPKVIDFGVAKALAGSSLHQVTMTGAGNFIGTPDYMSPEQAGGDAGASDVDTRTDVYSLGVVLYELLTGVLPFDREQTRGDILQMIRMIREVEPPKPSTRLSRLSGVGGEGIVPDGAPAPARRLRGDLDWIVMRAMDKSRERRYQSPGALAADIGRHLRTEPVEAGPPGAAYRVSKFVRRNKVFVGAAVLSLAAVVGGLGAALYGLRQAVVEGKRATDELRRAESANRFITHSIETGRLHGLNADFTFRDLIDSMAANVGSIDNTQPPEDRAAVRIRLGDIYNALRLRTEAEEQLVAAINELKGERVGDNLQLARASVELARVRVYNGRMAEAAKVLDEVLPELRRSRVEDIRALLPSALTARGMALARTGEHAQAEHDLREAISLLRSDDNDSEQSLCEAQTILAQVLGDIPDRRAEALAAAEAAVEIGTAAGEWNPAMRITALNTLGRVKRDRGDTRGAIDTYRESLKLATESKAVPRLSIASIEIILAQALRDVGETNEAGDQAQSALAARRELEPGSLRVAEALDVTAGLDLDRNDPAGAEGQYREMLAIARDPKTRSDPTAALAMTGLADSLIRQDKFAEAESLAESALVIRSRTLPAGHWKLSSTRSIIGAAAAGLGKCDDAENLLRPAAEAVVSDPAAPPLVVRRVLERLISMLEKCGKSEIAGQWRDRLQALPGQRP